MFVVVRNVSRAVLNTLIVMRLEHGKARVSLEPSILPDRICVQILLYFPLGIGNSDC